MMENSGPRREQKLLLLCTQVPFDNRKRAEFAAVLEGPVDWEYLVETSSGHAITPLLCRALELASPSRVPPDVLAAAKTYLDDTRTRNVEMTQELLRILDGLDHAGIPAIPFKGPYLAENYYGDPALRRYVDLDFLVAEKTLNATVTALRGLSYPGPFQTYSIDPDFKLSPRQDAAFRRYSEEYELYHSETSMAIEPHWAFVPRTFGLNLDYGPLWARTRRGVLADRAVLALSPEDTLLGLALHGAKSHWMRINWISDLDRVVKTEIGINWPELLQIARQSGLLRILLVGLQLIHLQFNTELDEQVSAAIANDPMVEQLAAECAAALFNEAARHYSSKAIWRDWRLMLERRRDRMAYIFYTLVTPRVQHFEALPLPDTLFFAYYPFKLAHDYIALPLWLAAKKLGRVRHPS